MAVIEFNLKAVTLVPGIVDRVEVVNAAVSNAGSRICSAEQCGDEWEEDVACSHADSINGCLCKGM
jgi:hypothetical protein